MRIGLALPHYDFSFPDAGPVTWERVAQAAGRAEALGFDSIWISDHLFLDLARYGGTDEPAGSLEPFTALAALSTATTRVRLGTLVACSPFRHPAHLVKLSTGVDLLSGGRFDLGIGAGWYEREFDAFGYDFGGVGERFAALEDSVAAVAALFRSEPATLDTPTVTFHEAYNRPPPAQAGGPPIWVGGKGGDRLLRLVAAHGSGWNTVWRWTPEAHRERATRLREIADAQGRDPTTVRLSVGLYTLVGENEADLAARYRALQAWAPGGSLDDVSLEGYAEDALVGTPQACLDRLAAFAETGVEEMIVGAASVPFAVHDWSALDIVSEAIIPAAHDL
ncbi:MAG TPA: LLM class flavin-dependent oxidoreductase [Actinomycetota bacterium]|jgi:probable F420-dependent oxidoreductase